MKNYSKSISDKDFLASVRKMEEDARNSIDPNFKFTEEDLPVVYQLLIWFLKDEELAKKTQLSLKKGILLLGPVGSGKSSLMSLCRKYVNETDSYSIRSTPSICLNYSVTGNALISEYSLNCFKMVKGLPKPKTICFDDLGSEEEQYHFGQKCNVMEKILFHRYEQFKSNGMITHATTNLDGNELGKKYGDRVRSRMREMFNLIQFAPDAKDKRI